MFVLLIQFEVPDSFWILSGPGVTLGLSRFSRLWTRARALRGSGEEPVAACGDLGSEEGYQVSVLPCDSTFQKHSAA